jgi:cytoskeletal protein RodZ
VSIGETLARARHRAGLSVAQVSEQTRIRPLIIRGIEADDYSMSGGDFYARGNIRDIAEVVGADPGPLIEEYDHIYRGRGPVAATSLDELLDRSRPDWHRRPGFMLVFGVAAVLIALAFVGYRMMAGSPSPSPVSAAANTSASPAQDGNGSGGRPDAARTARATAGSSSAPSSPLPVSSPAPSPSRSATPSGALPPGPAAGRPHAMPPASAAAFAAGGGMGQGDDPQDARLAIDGLRGTAWHTDWYTTAHFGNLYPGTGLLVDMGRPVTVAAVRVTLGPAAGAHFQIRVGDQPALAGLPPAARSAGPGGVVRLTLASPVQGRYVLVWFTRLPPDPAGTFKAQIYGISVKGHR